MRRTDTPRAATPRIDTPRTATPRTGIDLTSTPHTDMSRTVRITCTRIACLDSARLAPRSMLYDPHGDYRSTADLTYVHDLSDVRWRRARTRG